MPDTRTPGWVAYEAYCLVIFVGRPDLAHNYGCLAERAQRAWEAAAQAVLDAYCPPLATSHPGADERGDVGD